MTPNYYITIGITAILTVMMVMSIACGHGVLATLCLIAGLSSLAVSMDIRDTAEIEAMCKPAELPDLKEQRDRLWEELKKSGVIE